MSLPSQKYPPQHVLLVMCSAAAVGLQMLLLAAVQLWPKRALLPSFWAMAFEAYLCRSPLRFV
jgi:hypothetical protein